MKRVKTGIPGMDEILHGGIPERNVVLLSGGPGTGKSIFCQQFLYKGVTEFNEPAVLIALEEHPVQVRENMKQFGWDVKKLEEEGKFAIIDAFTYGIGAAAKRERYVVNDPTDERELIDVLKQAINDISAKRIGIDSVTTLYINKPMMARRTVFLLKRVIAGLGCTAIFTSQISVGERGFGGPGVEHAVDGIIRLDLDEVDGELKRSLIVWKMRGTSHSLRRHPFEITDNGIIVYHDKVLKLK
ncbi:hypothetical protein J422_06683 [Methanocaldococcus villosus KIN24-T80]|uniref:UPF0273 protein J422_06683 n=1 Tax=Methanocaldococcus villosus KIN24-T80 TaxID=1069083 RepID=N6V032_9EURY|nr:KaiC domain-containing protein [Methanocaldococcus villosus]ENN95653.1 hypothetical protein J422_06683 [Methanocaldococcus villosus KIN24-T80]